MQHREKQSDKTTAMENQVGAFTDLEEKLKAAEAQVTALDGRASLANELEAENERLRGDLQAATESIGRGEEDAQQRKALHEQLVDLQSLLDSSRSEQKILAEQMHDYEQLRQEVASLRGVVRQTEDKQERRSSCGWTLEALREEADNTGTGLSASQQNCGKPGTEFFRCGWLGSCRQSDGGRPM